MHGYRHNVQDIHVNVSLNDGRHCNGPGYEAVLVVRGVVLDRGYADDAIEAELNLWEQVRAHTLCRDLTTGEVR